MGRLKLENELGMSNFGKRHEKEGGCNNSICMENTQFCAEWKIDVWFSMGYYITIGTINCSEFSLVCIIRNSKRLMYHVLPHILVIVSELITYASKQKKFEIEIVEFRGNFLGLTLTTINALDLEGNF